MSVFTRKFGTVLFAIGATIFCSILAYAGITRLFSIATIEVVGSGITVVVDQKKIPRNLLFFPGGTIKQEILRYNPILSDVIFIKKYPRTLVIQPVMRTPAAILHSGETVALIDSEGLVLGYGDQGYGSLPQFVFPLDAIRVGGNVKDAKLILALTLLNRINLLDRVLSVKQNDESSVFFQTQKTGIYITQDAHPDETIATLQTLFEGFRIKGTLPRVVDLRFDKPVVQF